MAKNCKGYIHLANLGSTYYSCCNYLLDTGRRHPCKPDQYREMGVYQTRSRKKRKEELV